jgi:hypothetical protein
MRAGGPEARVQRRDLRGKALEGLVQRPGSARASLQSQGGRGSGKRVWSWRFEARRQRRCPGAAGARAALGWRPPIDCARRRAPARPAGRPTQPIWRWQQLCWGHAPRARGRRIGRGALWVRRKARKLWAWRAPGPRRRRRRCAPAPTSRVKSSILDAGRTSTHTWMSGPSHFTQRLNNKSSSLSAGARRGVGGGGVGELAHTSRLRLGHGFDPGGCSLD